MRMWNFRFDGIGIEVDDKNIVFFFVGFSFYT